MRNVGQVISNQHLFTLGKPRYIKKKKKIGQFPFLKAESRLFKREKQISPSPLSLPQARNWVTKLNRVAIETRVGLPKLYLLSTQLPMAKDRMWLLSLRS